MKRIMKAIFVAGALCCLNLTVAAQYMALKIKQVTVKQAMVQLKNTTGYSFVYEAGDVDTKRVVSVAATNLNTAVRQILSGQNLTYEIQGKNIVVHRALRMSTNQKK